LTTREEYDKRIRIERIAFDTAWDNLYPTKSEGSQITEDFLHPPPALADFIADLLREGLDAVGENVTQRHEAGDLEPGEPTFDWAMSKMMDYAQFISIRLYRIAQHMNAKYSFESMTACPCSILFDDEVDEFLKAAVRGGEPNETLPIPEDDGGSIRGG
jgi:hypothetical protein